MSLIRTTSDYFENFTVIARPVRTFTSSSSGVTGSVRVYPRASSTEKNPAFTESFGDRTADSILEDARKSSGSYQVLDDYLKAVNSIGVTPRNLKSMEILRFTPPVSLNSDTQRKLVFKDRLVPFYRTGNPKINWGYTNYSCLNFFSSSGLPSSASLIYANPAGSDGFGVYTPPGPFTIEFYVKPTSLGDEGFYNAGTILHVSSSFAVSLVSGSRADSLGRPTEFKILLQLSQSAEVPPRNVQLGITNNERPFPQDMIFESSPFLKNNTWHHVAIRWGGTSINFGTGTFTIDGQGAGTFIVPSSSISQASFSPLDDPNAVFVGNFFEGVNSPGGGISHFFNSNAVTNEGVDNSLSISDDYDPTSWSMLHPLRAELHEVRIWKTFRNSLEVQSGSQSFYSSGANGLAFYLPPHFTRESTTRKVLDTPFSYQVKGTDTPFNVTMSFGVGGHEINVENHVREMVRGSYPRLLFLTASDITTNQVPTITANDVLMGTGSVVGRNYLILPNDNGRFVPNFSNLSTGSSFLMEMFRNDAGDQDLSFVNLSSVVSTGSIFTGLTQQSGSFFDQIAGSSPESMGGSPTSNLTILQRTLDPSSNLVSFYDASNLFYGTRIHPTSYRITDYAMTGSGQAITLRDNGFGTLYRADCEGPHPTWAVCGIVLYDEGVACVTNPYLGDFFGKSQFDVEMRGEQPINVLEMQAIIPAFQANSSSNPNWMPLTASDYANDKSDSFVMIDTVNFHDEYLNVVAKASLAQPVQKRDRDRIMFRVKFDF
jgi:hypothetical protein